MLLSVQIFKYYNQNIVSVVVLLTKYMALIISINYELAPEMASIVYQLSSYINRRYCLKDTRPEQTVNKFEYKITLDHLYFISDVYL